MRTKSGVYSPGMKVPSLNVMSGILGISKETVYKAYDALIKLGILVSRHGKGYYVSAPVEEGGLSVLILLSEINPNMSTILSSFMERVGDEVKVTVRFHNQNPETLKDCIKSEFGKYDYYLIFPHFPEDVLSQEQTAAILRRLPPEKLIVMDRFLPGMGVDCGMSYQYIPGDIQTCMEELVARFRHYNRLRSLPIYTSLYGNEIDDALRQFCFRRHIPFEVADPENLSIYKGDVFFIYGCSLGHAFVSLNEIIRASRLKVGEDVGIICYDDFQINEILFDGLTTLSTDYAKMGREAAEMILEGRLRQAHCLCTLERRRSF